MLNNEFDQRIADLATPRQLEYYSAFCEHGSQLSACSKTDFNRSSMRSSMDALEKKAVSNGVMPAYTKDSGVGMGRIVNKVTTHIKDGEIAQEWVRTDNNAEDVLTQVMEAVTVLSAEVQGCSQIIPPPRHCVNDLVSLYPLFDKHYGMLSWRKETGEAYDLEIAEAQETEVFDYLVNSQPASKEALVVFGGDYFHCDDDNQVTPSHKNKVDVDGRSDKVFGVGVKMARKYITMVLKKHEHVTIELIPGNHDPVLSMALRYVISMYYENNERVTVNANPCRFSYYEFGSTLLAFQHGDKMKQERMYQVVTTDKREAWGRVKYCHTFTAHFHRERTIDIGLMKLESLRTTVPNEAYAHDAGYRSPKTAYAITFSREGGEVGRTTRNIAGSGEDK